MKKYTKNQFLNILVLLCLIIFSSCGEDTSKVVIEGKYENNYKGDYQYIVIKDTTYVYYYKGKLGEFKHEDKIIKYRDEKSIEINFKNWIYHTPALDDYCKDGCNISVTLKKGVLKFDPDLPNETYFYKIED